MNEKADLNGKVSANGVRKDEAQCVYADTTSFKRVKIR